MHDHHWLYNAPCCPGAVQWSEDNHLAVAAAHTVVILNPGFLNGARAYAALPEGSDVSASLVDGLPQALGESAQAIWAVASEAKLEGNKRAAQQRSISWSPAGCTAQGGCLLATVATDNTVRLYGATGRGAACEWDMLVNMTDLMKQELRQRNWQDLDTLAQTQQGDEVLRIRGGSVHKSITQQLLTQQSQVAADSSSVRDVLRLRGGAGQTKRKAADMSDADTAKEVSTTPQTEPTHLDVDVTEGAQVNNGHNQDIPADDTQQPAAKRKRALAPPDTTQDVDAAANLGSEGTTTSGKHPTPKTASRGRAALLSALQQGDRVEVQASEEGFGGCWFAGVLAQVCNNWMLVEYDDLIESEASSAKLCEWYPSPAAKKGDMNKLPTHHEKLWGRKVEVRPAPPAQVTRHGQLALRDLHVGMVVEAFHDDGFWAATVLELPQQPAPTASEQQQQGGQQPSEQPAAGEGDASSTVKVQLADEIVNVPVSCLRLPVKWQGGKWHVLVGADDDKAQPTRIKEEPGTEPKSGTKARKHTADKSGPSAASTKAQTPTQEGRSVQKGDGKSVSKSPAPPRRSVKASEVQPMSEVPTTVDSAPGFSEPAANTPTPQPATTSANADLPADVAQTIVIDNGSAPQPDDAIEKNADAMAGSAAQEKATPSAQPVRLEGLKSSGLSAKAAHLAALQHQLGRAKAARQQERSENEEDDQTMTEMESDEEPAGGRSARKQGSGRKQSRGGSKSGARGRGGKRGSTAAADADNDGEATQADQSEQPASAPGKASKARGRGSSAGQGRAKGKGRAAVKKEPEGEVEDIELDMTGVTAAVFEGLVAQCNLDSPEQVARSASQLITKRFQVLRHERSEVPRYKDRESIKGTDKIDFQRAYKELLHVFSDITGIQDQATLLRNARALSRHYIMKAEFEKRNADGDVEEDNANDTDTQLINADQSVNYVKLGKVIALPPYNPEGTNPNVFKDLLPAVNLEDDKVLADKAQYLIFQRFLVLRDALPEDQLPVYAKAERMKEPDISLLAQAFSEMVHVYGSRLPLTDQYLKTVVKHVRAFVRKRVIGVKAFFRKDLGIMYEPPTHKARRSATPGISDNTNNEELSLSDTDDDMADYTAAKTPRQAGGGSGTARGRGPTQSVTPTGMDTGLGMTSANRPRRASAAKAIKYVEGNSDTSSEEDVGKKRGKKRRKRASSPEESSDEYRVSEDEEVAVKTKGKGTAAMSDLSSDEISLASEKDDDDVTADDEPMPSDDDDDDMVVSPRSKPSGRGGGGRRTPVRSLAPPRNGRPSETLKSIAGSTAVDASAGIGWRSLINFKTGMNETACGRLIYTIKPSSGQPHNIGPNLHIGMPLSKKGYRDKNPMANIRLEALRSNKRVDNAIYDARLLGMAILHASWSPVCIYPSTDNNDNSSTAPAHAVRSCILSLGAKSGQLHLWRCQLPNKYHVTNSNSLDGSTGPSSMHIQSQLTYLGSLHAHCHPISYATCSTWAVMPTNSDDWHVVNPRLASGQDLVLLITGTGNGSIRLWRGAGKHLCLSGPTGLQPVCDVTPADHMGINCIDVCLSEPNSQGHRHLTVAAGKASGSIMVWRSGAMTCAADLDEAVKSSQSWLVPAAHGLTLVTGVKLQAWMHEAANQQGSPSSRMSGAQSQWQLLTSTGLDGNVLCWRITSNGLQPASEPQRFNPMSAYNAPSSTANMPASNKPAYGVAASSNGLVLAVARTSDVFEEEQAHAGVTAKMTWKRVALGSVHLYTVFGEKQPDNQQGAPCGPLAPLLPRLARQLSLQWPGAATCWDIAAAVVMAGWVPVTPPAAVLTNPPDTPSKDAGHDRGGASLFDDDDDQDNALEEDDDAGPANTRNQQIRRSQAAKHMLALKQAAAMLDMASHLLQRLDEIHNKVQTDGQPNGSKSKSSTSTTAETAASGVALRALQAATALRHLFTNYLHANQQLNKSLAIFEPMLHQPSQQGNRHINQDADSIAEAGRIIAQQHNLPAWLFQPAARSQLQSTEPELLSVPVSISKLAQELRANEFELLQLHVLECLKQQAQNKDQQPSLSQLLMSDWVTLLSKSEGQAKHQKGLLPLAKAVLSQAKDKSQSTSSGVILREHSSSINVPIGICGSDVVLAARTVKLKAVGNDWELDCNGTTEASQQQGSGSESVTLELHRCGATLQLCDGLVSWQCQACRRRYKEPCTERPGRQGPLPDVPHCVMCGVRLGKAAAPQSFLPAPALQLQPIPPEPVTLG